MHNVLQFLRGCQILALACATFGLSFGCAASSRPAALAGVTDASHWSAERDGPLTLDGSYEFWWGQFIDPATFAAGKAAPTLDTFVVPNTWNGHRLKDGRTLEGDGFGTLRLRVRRSTPVREELAVRLPFFLTAYTLFANGNPVCSNGRVGHDLASSIPGNLPCTNSFVVEGPEIDFVIHVSNFHHARGGPRTSIQLGTPGQMSVRENRQGALDALLFGSILIMGIYHAIFYLVRRKETAYLYLFLISLCVVVRTLGAGENILARLLPGMSWETYFRIVACAAYIVPFAFYLFVRGMFPAEASRIAVYPYAVLTILAVGSLLLPVQQASAGVGIFIWLIYANCAHILICIGLAAWRRRVEGLSLFVGTLIWCGFVMNDLLYQYQVVNTGYYLPVGLFFLISTQMIVMARRFARVQDDAESTHNDLDARNRELERFTYSVSHDLKSPIVTIQSFTGFVREAERAGTRDRIPTDLAHIERAARKMSALLGELTELSRIGRNAALPVNCDVDELVDEALAVLREGKRINDVLLHREPLRLSIRGDRARLLQVLERVLDNALKYAGTSTEQPRVRIYPRREGKETAVAIEDNGIGIDPRYQSRVYELFEKLDPGAEGTGMGLAIAKRIVDLHGGRLWCESPGIPGEGTTFFILLPAVETRERPRSGRGKSGA